TFRLLDGRLPTPRWTSVRRAVPDFDLRMKRAIRFRLWVQGTFAQTNDYAGFRDWLASPRGKAAYAEAKRLADRMLPRDLDQEDLVSYATRKRSRPVLSRPQEPGSGPQFIDHADVLQTSEGRVFIAIMDAGLSDDQR